MHHARQPDVVQVVALAADEARVLLALQPPEADRPLLRGARKVLDRGHPHTSCLAGGLVLRGPLDGGDDVLVAGAATDRPGDRRRGSPASVGFGFSSSSARVVISMPGVQKPHWSACVSWKPCWIGSSRPSTSSDSTVLISWPSHITASVVHDFTGRPSISTTHAPQFEVSQPQWVPVRPGVSRMKWTSSCRGSTSRDDLLPVDVDGHLHAHASWCCARAAARRRARFVRTPARWRL